MVIGTGRKADVPSGTNSSIWWGNYGSFFEPISQRGRGFTLGLELKKLQRIWISAKKTACCDSTSSPGLFWGKSPGDEVGCDWSRIDPASLLHSHFLCSRLGPCRSRWLLDPARLRVVPHFSSGIVEWAKHERAWKSLHARKGPARSKWPAFTSFYEKSNSGYAIKPKKTVKRQTDTKTQWNTLQVSLFFYPFHLRKSKV